MTPTEAIKEIKEICKGCTEMEKDMEYAPGYAAAWHRDKLLTKIFKICMEVK